MDLKTRTMSPEDQAERLAARQAYLDAVRAWVTTGRYALPAGDARAALPKVTREIAEAHARFRLGVWLRTHGNPVEGDRQMNTASALHPQIMEYVAPGRRPRRGRQGLGSRFLETRAGLGRSAILSASETLIFRTARVSRAVRKMMLSDRNER